VLTPGGRLVVEEPNIEHWHALGERLILMRSHFHQPETLHCILERRGGRVTMYSDDTANVWVVDK